MGIQTINAPLRQMRRPAPPAPSEDLTELAGSREPARIPQRQRGLWSFLTWPFVIAPIVAAEASLVGNGHALATEDQDDRAADHGREQPDVPADHEQIVAGAAHAPDDSRDDETDAPRLVATTPKALHDADAHDKVPIARDTVATESQAGDTGSSAGGGGGRGGVGGSGGRGVGSGIGPRSEHRAGLVSGYFHQLRPVYRSSGTSGAAEQTGNRELELRGTGERTGCFRESGGLPALPTGGCRRRFRLRLGR